MIFRSYLRAKAKSREQCSNKTINDWWRKSIILPNQVKIIDNRLAPKIEDNVELGANVSIIGNSRIRKNCIIGAGATIANSKIGNNTKIGPGCVISRCNIGDNCKIRAGVVLYNVEVPSNSVVESPKPIIRKS